MTERTRIGKYELLGSLGRGGMGEVYRARDTLLDREVALKTISETIVAVSQARVRFLREARAAARLEHPNIVTIYELGESEGAPYIVMELLTGSDLTEVLRDRRSLDLPRALRWLVDVCRALDFAHGRGVVHRDIKPGNIRVLADGSVKLVDFGVARLVDSQLTRTGHVLGTPAYTAPEVLRGEKADSRSDLWSVGVILYELLSGRRPYDGDSYATVVYKVISEPLPPLSGASLPVPPRLVAVVERALAKEPHARYGDLAELGRAIEGVLADQGSARADQGYPDETMPLGNVPAIKPEPVAARPGPAAAAPASAPAPGPERVRRPAKKAESPSPARTESPVRPVAVPKAPSAKRPVRAAARAPKREQSPQRPVAVPNAPREMSRLRQAAPGRGEGRSASVVLDIAALRSRGASVYREQASFGEPPGTQKMCLIPPGERLAVSGSDGSVRLWDLRSRRPTAQLRTAMHTRIGHEALIVAMAPSPDGALLATGHVDGSVHLWHLASQREYPVKLRHKDAVSAMTFAPDGRTLASGGTEESLRLWDVASAVEGEARRDLLRQPSRIGALAFSTRGDLLASGHARGTIRLIDSRTRRLSSTLRGAAGLVTAMVFAGPGLVAASEDSTLRVFDVAERVERQVVRTAGPVSSVCLLAGGEALAAVGLDRALRLYDLEKGSELGTLVGRHGEHFVGVAAVADGRQLVVALADGSIRIWEAVQE